MSELTIRIINQSANPLPVYATDGASGMDLRASLNADIVMAPLEDAWCQQVYSWRYLPDLKPR